MTRASDIRPVRRVVCGAAQEFAIEVSKRLLTIRPLGSRRSGPAEVTLPWGAIYIREVDRLAAERLRAKRAAKKGGRR